MPVKLDMPVLVVDDFETTIRIIRNLLRQIGFTAIDGAANGIEALEKLRAREYGLVISDWNMEPMNGLKLLHNVRTDKKLSMIPFIMVTAESKTENVVNAKKLGVNNYIIKPFDKETLQRKIDAVFAN